MLDHGTGCSREDGGARAGDRVLIVAPKDDLHATEVAKRLAARSTPCDIVDLGAFPGEIALSMRFGRDDAYILRLPDGREIAAADVGAVWWRRPRHPEIAPDIVDPSFRQFAFNEARSAIGGFWECLDCRWVNPIGPDLKAGYKPYQLKIARECGLAAPDTLITNDPAAAVEFIRRHDGQVIYKALLGLPNAWRETRLLRREEHALLPLVRHAPVIFQELVVGADLRVTVVGDTCFVAEFDTSQSRYPYDIRMDMTTPAAAASLDPATTAAIRRYMRRLGIVYGAIDLRRRPDGRLAFLEINPGGQFLFAEELAGLPISQALADYLADGPRAWRPGAEISAMTEGATHAQS